LNFDIVACFYPPIVQTTTGTSSTMTTTLPSTTTIINYCTEENGMNQPLTIQPNQVTSSPPNNNTTPSDINPTTTTTPGLDFSSPNPQINITFTQPAALTVIYVPTDRPDQPTNVEQFVVVFLYPNQTSSEAFPSETPSPTTTTTTTPSTGAPSETSTTPSTSGIVLPSDVSPQVDLPPNFRVPEGTIVIINITSTTGGSPATGVCIVFIPLFGFYKRVTTFFQYEG
jgi:hypothetical protein